MKRSKFSLSHYKLCTMDMGTLIPLTWYEVLPGDTIQQATSALIRATPLVGVPMHPVRVRLHHWFVPNRLIWDDFEDFITGGSDGNDASVHPVISSASITEGSLHDYFGVPVGTYSPNLEYSALPFRAYAKIYNEHYRDQDLVTELTVDTTSGTDSTTNTTIQRVGWEKDYFTTARPWEQKGTQVTIPLGTTADVISDTSTNEVPTFNTGTGPTTGNYLVSNASHAATDWNVGATGAAAATWDDPKLVADLANATGIDINDFRLALAIQRYQENRARYGSRYTEYLRSLGVRSSDGRLQNPEYLGGGRQIIQFSEVLQTAEGTGTVVGEMKGHGIAALRSNRYRRFFEEHGIVMTLMSVIPKTIYTQGLSKKWTREVKEDYYQKELVHLGEQPILNKEVYAEHTTPDGTFGYQARYDEYRSIPSSVSGEFLSTMDHWHFGRVFSSDPSLNQSFIEATPTKRTFASTSTDCLYVMANHSIQARRPLPKRGTPRTI